MKIAFIYDDCLSGLGGVQRVLNSLANHFSQKFKYKVEIVNFYSKKKDIHYNYSKDVKITYLNIFLGHKNFILKYIKKIYRIDMTN